MKKKLVYRIGIIAMAMVLILSCGVSVASACFYNYGHYYTGSSPTFPRNDIGDVYTQDEIASYLWWMPSVEYRCYQFVKHWVGSSIYEESGWLWAKKSSQDGNTPLGYWICSPPGMWHWLVWKSFAYCLNLENLCWGWNPTSPAWEGQKWEITWKVDLYVDGWYRYTVYYKSTSHDER